MSRARPPAIGSCALGVSLLLMASVASAQQPAGAGTDPQASVNNILNQSLGSINECYRGVHEYFNDDVVGWAMKQVFTKAAEPGGICDQYLQHSAEIPLELSVPLLPGISMNTEKVCKLIKRPACAK